MGNAVLYLMNKAKPIIEKYLPFWCDYQDCQKVHNWTPILISGALFLAKGTAIKVTIAVVFLLKVTQLALKKITKKEPFIEEIRRYLDQAKKVANSINKRKMLKYDISSSFEISSDNDISSYVTTAHDHNEYWSVRASLDIIQVQAKINPKKAMQQLKEVKKTIKQYQIMTFDKCCMLLDILKLESILGLGDQTDLLLKQLKDETFKIENSYCMVFILSCITRIEIQCKLNDPDSTIDEIKKMILKFLERSNRFSFDYPDKKINVKKWIQEVEEESPEKGNDKLKCTYVSSHKAKKFFQDFLKQSTNLKEIKRKVKLQLFELSKANPLDCDHFAHGHLIPLIGTQRLIDKLISRLAAEKIVENHSNIYCEPFAQVISSFLIGLPNIETLELHDHLKRYLPRTD